MSTRLTSLEEQIQAHPRLRAALYAGGILILFVLVYLVSEYFFQRDWQGHFRPAAQAIFHGISPYTIEGYYSPPWVAMLLIPFALLPARLSFSAYLTASLLLMFYVTQRLSNGKSISILLILMTPSTLLGFMLGNIDWLCWVGFVLPPPVGLFFALAKPQLGVGMVVFWLFEGWREGGIRRLIEIFAPVTVVTLLSFLIFGFWPRIAAAAPESVWNTSFWPVTIPVGLALLVHMVRSRQVRYGIAASPCLSPYVAGHSWTAGLLTIATQPFELTLAVIGMWVAFLYTGLVEIFPH